MGVLRFYGGRQGLSITSTFAPFAFGEAGIKFSFVRA